MLQVVRLFKCQDYSRDKNATALQKLTSSRETIQSCHSEFCKDKTPRIKNMKLASKL